MASKNAVKEKEATNNQCNELMHCSRWQAEFRIPVVVIGSYAVAVKHRGKGAMWVKQKGSSLEARWVNFKNQKVTAGCQNPGF